MSGPASNDNGFRNVEVRADLLERGAAKVACESALADLHGTIAAYSQLFAEGDLATKREATWRTFDALATFLVDQGLPIEAMLPLLSAGSAAGEAARGIADPIFMPKRTHGGRPPEGGLWNLGEGVFAAVAELCIRAKKAAGAKPYIDPGLGMACKMMDDAWGVKIKKRQLKDIREKCDPNGDRLGDIAMKGLLDSPLADEAPLEYARALLKHDRAALYCRLKLSR